MKKRYITPLAEVLVTEQCDIITQSVFTAEQDSKSIRTEAMGDLDNFVNSNGTIKLN